jgi:hypothetical protein
MYLPDDFAGITVLSGRVHQFVLRWAHRHRAKRGSIIGRERTCLSANRE